MRMKKGVAVLLTLALLLSTGFLSLSYPELKTIFSVSASAVDDVISKYAPEGTRDVAVDASVSASSSYTSGNGQWELARINDGSLYYYGGENGYNGKAGFTSHPDEVPYHPTNMTQDEKDAAVAESKTKPLWIAFDLEGFYDVSRVVLFRHGSFPDTIEIQVSDDGESYETVTSVSGYAGYTQEALAIDFTTLRTRYIRVYVTVRGDLEGNYIHLVQLGEIAVFGTEVAAADNASDIDSYAPENCINLAVESTVTATESYEEGEKWGVHNINDEDIARNGGYSSEPADRPMSIDFSLGNVAEVKRLVIFPNGVFPKSFEIQTSFDGVTYKTIKTESGLNDNPQTPVVFELPQATFASFIRINVTERHSSGSYYVQFAEIGIYGVKGAYNAELNKSVVNLVPGDTLQLELTVDNLNSFDPYEHNLEWKSSDESVVTVDPNGLLTAVSSGTTTVTVSDNAIGFSKSVRVTVGYDLPYARDEMTVSIFAPPTGDLFTDEQYKLVSEADVDLVLNTYNVYTPEDNLKLLELAGKYGMTAVVADMRLRSDMQNITKEQFEQVYEDYKGISNLEGFYVYDEPWNPNAYVNSANHIASTIPGGFIYLNLFPGFVYNSYEQYEYIFDDVAALTDGNVDLMFDVYPFMQDGTTDYQTMFDSLDTVRRSGLKYDVNTAACVQAIGYGPIGGELVKRIPNEEDVLYQNMAYLAYGVKHVAYFKYSQEADNGQENYSTCPVDENGNPTDVYYYMQRINPIVHTLGDTLIDCDAKEVYITGADTYGQSAVPGNFFVQSADSSNSLILSYMTHRDTGRNYLMVVNNDLSKSVTAPLKFASGINSIEILDNATGEWTKSAVSGSYNVSLPAGGAALIALDEDYRYEEVKEQTNSNVLYGKTVYGNSSLGTPGTRDEMLPGWYLSCLTDGYIDANASKGLNGWCSELRDESFETFVEIDLGTVQTLNSLTLHAVASSTGYNGYFPKSYTVSTSVDGDRWTQIASSDNSSVTSSVTHDFSATDMRYIRVDINEMNSIDGKYAAAIAEIETNGEVAISRYKTVAADENGFYAYMNCVNTDYIRVPAWTDYNGQDDIIWHTGESGSWTINGFTYNFRAYIPISEHNNERGRYTVHLYAYNENGETSKGTYFEFSSNVTFDLNYDGISKNLMSGLGSLSSGGGVSATYDSTDETVTLNGALTQSINLQPSVSINEDISIGDTLRVTVEQVSGSMSNGIIVLELFNDSLANPDGKRHVADIVSAGVYDIPVTTQRAAEEISNYKFWLYYDGRGQYFDNFTFKIKLEVVSGDSVYSPSGKMLDYGESYGTLYTPERSDAEFVGWFTAPEGGVQVTSATVNYGITDRTLYAQWRELEAEFVYGLYPGITAEKLESDYFTLTNVTYEYENVNGCITTGTLVTATDKTTGKVVAKYILVLFGDVNSDGWYDGQDAVYTEAIRAGMLDADSLGEAAYLAADCNHDGLVGFTDTYLLNKAGALLSEIDQTKPSEELATMSEWQEYISVIDQEPEIENPEDTAPDTEDNESGMSVFDRIIDFLISFIRKIIAWFFK
ncbi:MAG: discoidin domain-containing protein [Clostridia bacterium]|nr:discoidin domain-containing protein [Clostridia bacterium]